MTRLTLCAVSAAAWLFAALGSATAATLNDLVAGAADRLVINQGVEGGWSGESGFTGSIVSGLANAYSVTGDADYLDAARSGGQFIFATAGGNFYGDEAYALTRLSQLSNDPSVNPWRSAVVNFYSAVRGAPAGTSGYVSDLLAGTDRSNAVFYLANHAVAAAYVDAQDRDVWRSGLIESLSRISDDTSNYPVMSLGISLWALAQTGGIDAMTPVDAAASVGSTWYGRTLADLPGMLAQHQANDGTFYWRFDHAAPDGVPPSGFTEDTIFATLGLMAAHAADPTLNLGPSIFLAQQAIAAGMGADGAFYEHLVSGGTSYNVYAGEALQVLPEPSSLSLLGLGLLAAARSRGRSRRGEAR